MYLDAETWLPVAFFNFVEREGKEPQLCQLWVTPLGKFEWRPVNKRKEAGQNVFDECQVFDGGDTSEDS